MDRFFCKCISGSLRTLLVRIVIFPLVLVLEKNLLFHAQKLVNVLLLLLLLLLL